MDGTSIVRSDDLRQENRRRVLDTLRANESCSPAQLASHTSLSPAAISSLTTQMCDQGILRSTRPRTQGGSHRGRPQSLIALSAAAGDVITVCLTIDQLRLQRIDYSGVLVHGETLNVTTRDLGKEQLLDICCQAVSRMLEFESQSTVQRIGVAFQGVIGNDNGTLLWSPIITHEDVNLGGRLQARFDLPVTINNDCQLIAEALSHSAQQVLGSSFATVLFSHGVGLGLHIDGRPFTGIHSSALELGHLRFEREGALCRCGRRGCIEAYAADYGVERLATGKAIHATPAGRVDSKRMRALRQAAQSGDEPAMQAFAIAGAAIGEGLATVFTLLDAMPVALVGRSAEELELMRGGVKSVFRNELHNALAIDDLLHCFDDADPLLQSGLTHNTLSMLDRQFAYGSQSLTT